MRRIILGVLLAALVVGLFLIPHAASAQGSICISYDFTASDAGWVSWTSLFGGLGSATYNSGVGWGDDYATTGYHGIDIVSPSFSATGIYSVTVRSVGADTSANMSGSAQLRAYSVDEADSEIGGPVFWSNNVSISTTTSTSVTRLEIFANPFPGSGTTGPITAYITGIDIYCNAATPTPAPTTVPPPDSAFANFTTCPILGYETANFVGLPSTKWTLTPSSGSGAPHNPTGKTSTMELPEGSRAKHTLTTLSPLEKYSLTVNYHYSAIESGATALADEFDVVLGTSSLTITMDPDTDYHTFSVPPSNYSAYPENQWDLQIVRLASGSGRTVIVDSVCIGGKAGADAGGSGQVIDNGPGQCLVCTYEPTGNILNDIPLLFKWLWCVLSNLWFCTLLPLLTSMWTTALTMLRMVEFGRAWLSEIFSHLVIWAISIATVLWFWIGGQFSNVMQTAMNVGISLINALGLTGLLNYLLGFIQNIPSFFSAVLSWLANAAGFVSTAWTLVSGWATSLLNQTISILSAIPLLIASVIEGFNSSASIPVWAPACNDPGVILYYPCLTSYVLDYTVLDGPIFYVMPFVVSSIALKVIFWSLKLFRETFSV